MENLTSNMVLEESIRILASLPGISSLVKIFQAVGVLIIAYLVFLISRGLMEYKRFSLVKEIRQSISSIKQTLENIDSKISTANAKKETKKRS